MRVPHELLRETIAIEDFTGSGARGPVYAPARNVRASMQQTTRLFIDGRGNQRTVDILGIVRPEAGPVATESRVTWMGVTYRVEACYPMPDSRRPYHYELALIRLAS